MQIDPAALASLRMERLLLPHRAQGEAYDALFRDCSPVPAEGWCEPGTPPSLTLHAAFDDREYNARRRRARDILKGRFVGDTVGYVDRRDLELYACLCRKEQELTYMQERVLSLLHDEGPMSIGMMREFSGLLAKQLTPVLHKLQSAFLVFEDQAESGGDRGWFLFSEEFPEVSLTRYSREEACCRVLWRFAGRSVFFDLEMARGFYRLPAKLVSGAVKRLVSEGALSEAEYCGKAGFVRKEDVPLLANGGAPPRSVLFLERNGFLPRCWGGELARRFPAYEKWEAMGYLLADGRIEGAVFGRYKFGPHIVENVVLEGEDRRDEALCAVREKFDPVLSPVHRYNGRELA